ncbi:MAG TPA: sugar transferase [Bryobacteraceae bacterium]|nr:sugar transferase [Bryobacteraceae bacterium]
MKRLFDITAALTGLMLLAPLMILIAILIWAEDRRSPLYLASRVARGGGDFRMVKFRTMIPNAWKSGVNSTAAGDRRITRIGRWLRKGKLDELPQLWNVLLGDMSLVGPRPQVRADVALYTREESRMLAARPGITDLASIVFADEGEILEGSADPDLRYNQIIRPWKSRLILLYLENWTFGGDLNILWLTAIALFSRERALRALSQGLDVLGASEKLKMMASRKHPLEAWPPPGAEAIVSQYRSGSCGEVAAHA